MKREDMRQTIELWLGIVISLVVIAISLLVGRYASADCLQAAAALVVGLFLIAYMGGKV